MQQAKASGGGIQKILNVITQLLPIIIIGGLLYAGFFVKAEAVITKVEPKPVERRDNFFSLVSLMYSTELRSVSALTFL